MNNAKEFVALAKGNEEACTKEVQEVLKKYGCSIHWQEQKVDGQIVGAGCFFKFRPELFLKKEEE